MPVRSFSSRLRRTLQGRQPTDKNRQDTGWRRASTPSSPIQSRHERIRPSPGARAKIQSLHHRCHGHLDGRIVACSLWQYRFACCKSSTVRRGFRCRAGLCNALVWHVLLLGFYPRSSASWPCLWLVRWLVDCSRGGSKGGFQGGERHLIRSRHASH